MSENKGKAAIGLATSLLSFKAILIGLAATAIAISLLLISVIILGVMSASTTDEIDSGFGNGTGISEEVPEEYRQVVLRAGSICPTVTPPVIAAQIAAESNWINTAFSVVGASGISQFMPATWAEHGMDGDGDGKADIDNPIDAIWSQGNYMCALNSEVKALLNIGAINGDELDLTLASYNAGLGNVTEWNGVPPFSETIKYIERIRGFIPLYTGTIGTEQTVSGDVGKILAWAKSIAADKTNYYQLQGSGPKAWDCSGLTQEAYRQLGIDLPRTAHEQSQTGKDISASSAKPGDLIYWAWGSGHVFHTALYAGGGWMISADNETSGINFEPVYEIGGAHVFYKTHK